MDSLDAAREAASSGADRIELCGRGEGGLTPSRALLASVISDATIPVHMMVRPRTGGFVYSEDEVAKMRGAIEMAHEEGAGGVVFGVLRPDGTLDVDVMRELTELARPMRVGCHRAFDATPDADAALDQLIALGVDLVLTSGHAPTALEGVATLARHVQRAAGRITILAGGTVRGENVKRIVEGSGVTEVHARATDPSVIAALATVIKS